MLKKQCTYSVYYKEAVAAEKIRSADLCFFKDYLNFLPHLKIDLIKNNGSDSFFGSICPILIGHYRWV